ncbi:MAG: hypothetical protein IH945_04290 [Armatimonadetes bacterium]|nr:hypothetical protein [Armatimonadota bacterium]
MTMRVADEGGVTDRTVRRRFEVIEEARIETHDDGFVTMRFQDPDKHLGNFPRTSLKEIAECMNRLGFLDLRTLVTHGFPDGRSLGRSVPFSLLRILAPGYERHLQTFNQALPRYASALTPSEREVLLAGKPVTVGRLARDSKQRLNKLLIGSSDMYGNAVAFRNLRVPYNLTTVLMFPFGLPDTVTLQIDAKTVPGMAAFLPRAGDYSPWYVFGSEGMTISQIGSRLAMTDAPGRVWLGEILTGRFKLKQGDQTMIEYVLDLAMIDVRGKPLSTSDLSEEIQQRIERARASALQRQIEQVQRRKTPPPS